MEEPGRGDYIRWTPPMVEGESAAHRALNRGKRSATLNLKDPRGRELLCKLAGGADVLVESFRPGVMDRLGVGWQALTEVNPKLVYCAITGYGQDGPYRDVVGHDLNYIGYAGVLSITGDPGQAPAIPGVQIGDLGGGMLAAIGILAALTERAGTSRGRFVDVSMLDSVVSWLSIHAGAYLATGEAPGPGSMPLTGAYACYRVYRCGDKKYLTVGALEPQFWESLCGVLGFPEFVSDQYGPPARQEEMAIRLQSLFETRGRDEWLEALSGVAACVGPVNEFAEVMADPQVRHRGMVGEVEGVPVGPGPALRFADQPADGLRPPPGFGEHTAEALTEIGVGEEELAELRRQGVV